jgi:TctA family transporter
MIEPLFDALARAADAAALAFMALGVCVGLMVGVLPGLGGIAGCRCCCRSSTAWTRPPRWPC